MIKLIKCNCSSGCGAAMKVVYNKDTTILVSYRDGQEIGNIILGIEDMKQLILALFEARRLRMNGES